MPEATLKPCPFCGGEGYLAEESGEFYTRCLACFAQGPADGLSDESQYDTIARWNRRVSPWRDSAKLPPPKDGTWIAAHWSEDPYPVAIFFTGGDGADQWRNSGGAFYYSDPKWWMPIPPLEGE